MSDILISGAGIAGLSLARQLKKLGITYTIIEKRPNLDAIGAGIALPANATRALRYMGFVDEIDKMHQVKKIIYARTNGKIISEASLLSEPLNIDKFVALDRTELTTILKKDIEDDIQFNVSITNIKQTDTGAEVILSNPKLNGFYKAVVAADGIHSSVAKLDLKESNLRDLGATNWRWICDYPTKNLEPTYMLGLNNMFLAYPIGPNRIYCYAHQADNTGQYTNSENAKENLKLLLGKYKGIAKELLKLLPESDKIYTGRLCSVPKPRYGHKYVAFIGDASSACSPMLQQGAAAAFEDAITLSELLANFPVKEAIEKYQSQRQERVDWIVKTSDDSIIKFIKTKSKLSMFIRNLYIKRLGPLNVLGWKKLLSICPFDKLNTFINQSADKHKADIKKGTK
jgi:2-polyprenyl-6-methoxyphenol hydroxylase-like FAD-dependent oxidoreductase